MFHSYTHWKYTKTSGFLTFSWECRNRTFAWNGLGVLLPIWYWILFDNCMSLRENCPNTEFFLVRIQSEYGLKKNRKNSVFRHFSQLHVFYKSKKIYLRYLIKKIHQILQCRLYLNLVSEMVHIKGSSDQINSRHKYKNNCRRKMPWYPIWWAWTALIKLLKYRLVLFF